MICPCLVSLLQARVAQRLALLPHDRRAPNAPAVPPAADDLLKVPQGSIDFDPSASVWADEKDDILLLDAPSESEVAPAASASFAVLASAWECLWRPTRFVGRPLTAA